MKDAQRIQSQQDTLTSLVSISLQDTVKVSFFGGLDMGRVGTLIVATDNGLSVASLLDLAATKVKVIQDRAEYKDYNDICLLIREGITLDLALRAAMGVYGSNFNPLISLRALTYFEDGDITQLDEIDQKFLNDCVKNIDFDNLTSLPLKSDELTR